MKVYWTPFARQSLDAIAVRIHADNPDAAVRVAQRIMSLAGKLGPHPHMGVGGRARGTRELMVPEYPYLIMCRIEGQQVAILRVVPGPTLTKKR